MSRATIGAESRTRQPCPLRPPAGPKDGDHRDLQWDRRTEDGGDCGRDPGDSAWVLGGEYAHVAGGCHYHHHLPQEHHLQPPPHRRPHLGDVMCQQGPPEEPLVQAVLDAQREEKGDDPEAEERAVAQTA